MVSAASAAFLAKESRAATPFSTVSRTFDFLNLGGGRRFERFYAVLKGRDRLGIVSGGLEDGLVKVSAVRCFLVVHWLLLSQKNGVYERQVP
jgi:hypothetical protein